LTTSTVIATGRSGQGLSMRCTGNVGPARIVPGSPDGGAPMVPQAARTRPSARTRPLVDLPRIEDPLWIERIFHPFHHVERGPVLEPHVGLTYDTGPVFPGHRAPDLDGQTVQAVGELVGALHLVVVRGIDEDRRVDVP